MWGWVNMFPFEHFKSSKEVALDIYRFISEEGVEDPDACLEWAFGECYATMAIVDSADAWNERHGDLFIVSNSDLFVESIKKIARAYLKEAK